MTLRQAYGGGLRSATGGGIVVVPPTTDPHVVGALWNDHGTARFSAGPVPTVTGLLLNLIGQSGSKRRVGRATTTYQSGLRTLTEVGQTEDRSDGRLESDPLPASYFESTAAFTEFDDDKESWGPGYAAVADDDHTIAFSGGVGGNHFRDLMRGGSSEAWDNHAQLLATGPGLLEGLGATQTRIVTIWDQGEADGDTTAPGGGTSEGLITAPEYVEVLQELLRQHRFTSRVALNDATAAPDIWIVQIGQTETDGHRAVKQGQLDGALAIDGVNLIGPKYGYPFENDAVHLTGLGQRYLSEYAAHRVAEGGLPVYCTGSSRAGAVITLDYHTLSGDLVIDETNVPQTSTFYTDSLSGFEVFDGATALAISSVAVSGTQATITLAADPGGSVEVRYAQQTYQGGLRTVTGPNSELPRGNLRDSGSRTALHDGFTLYNWACAQTITVA